MKLYSYVRENLGLRSIEIEISLSPGLPKIQFLGMPDTLIKESVYRIQSALKHQGFKLPKAKQILVQLRPQHLKKTSLGLDLAVAAGILWETGQVLAPDEKEIALYGELSLKGEVSVPEDFSDIFESDFQRFYTGFLQNPPFALHSIKELKNLNEAIEIHAQKTQSVLIRPEIPFIKVSKIQNELLKLIAIGEHSTLLAGPPGMGKSTLAQVATSLLRDPPLEEFKKSQQISRYFGINLNWRPIVMPHHSATSLAMIGGGVRPQPGEITRAHGGVLILDEFLEFDPHVQEALREPLESGRIVISRMGNVTTYPARFLLIATTNLCQCGELVLVKNFECPKRPSTCLNYLKKLSGPILDRFSIVDFCNYWVDPKTIFISEICEDVKTTLAYIVKSRGQYHANQYVEFSKLEQTIDPFSKKNLIPEVGGSIRRYQSLIRVARTFADMDFSDLIKGNHLEKARVLTIENPSILKK